MNERLIIYLCALLALVSLRSGRTSETERTEAPACTLAPLGGGQSYTLKQFRGTVVYVDFWASWCTPCAQSFPFMNGLAHDLSSRGLQILAINLDENPNDAQEFLTRHPAHFSLASDADQQCATAFGVKAMPSSYLIDRNGIVRYEHLGFRPGEAEQFRVLAEQLLAEQPTTR
ncbi:MAG: TlpA disulfide reductase family protein [Gammaproteobacteria bacterium]